MLGALEMRAGGTPTVVRFANHQIIALCIALMMPLGSVAAAQALLPGAQVASQQGYSQSSWGLGVVVPEGSSLFGGGTLNWAKVTNVTAVIQIPDITNASAPVYAVLSLMTQDGTVLQTAYGIFPRNSTWLVYSMFIKNINQVPQHYIWVLNSSIPRAQPGDLVTISIYQSTEHVWSLLASNMNTTLSIQRTFGGNITEAPKSGDQEVFALESYASDSTTFRNMGNMTLISLLVDGERVESGWYLYAAWDLTHNPLFVVGGATPSSFVGASITKNGKVVWYYAGNWMDNGAANAAGPILVAMLILAGAAMGGFILSLRYIWRPRESKPIREWL